MGNDVIIRNALLSDAEAGARLHVKTWQSAYQGLMPKEFLETLKVEEFVLNWRKAISSIDESRLRVVAEDKGRIVGFVGAGPSRWDIAGFQEELYGIYVHPREQGRGVGRKLVEFYIDWLLDRKKEAFVLWVIKDNLPSRRFYEATGGIDLHQEKMDRSFGGMTLIEVAYGWKNLKGLTRP